MDFVFPPAAPTTVPVTGSTAAFPVGRVYCIGRNYGWSLDEAPPRGTPAWFMKPADAVVPAEGVLPYPPETDDFCHEIELVVAIGRGGRDINPAQVEPHHIWDYAAGLDLTRRDLLHATGAGGDVRPSEARRRVADGQRRRTAAGGCIRTSLAGAGAGRHAVEVGDAHAR